MACNGMDTHVLDDYQCDGFVSGIPILTPDKTAIHRQHLERAENVFWSSLHYVKKVHKALKSPLELARKSGSDCRDVSSHNYNTRAKNNLNNDELQL